MTTRTPQPTDVLATYRDDGAARQAADLVRSRGLAGGDAIHLGERAAEITSLQAEQREEMQHTFVGPGNVGPFTKEMTKSMLPAILGGSVIGAIVCLPLAWLRLGPAVELDFGLKVLIVVALGITTGATIGFVAGGGLGAKGPSEPLAAERGVTMSISAASRDEAERIADALRTTDPIRVDLATADGQPIATVTTEGELADL